MFGFVRNKTSIIILILLLVACAFVFGNTIPKEPSSSSEVVGRFLVARMSDSYGELDAEGSSHLHFIQTFVGDTGLHFDASSGSNDQRSYNEAMISAVITCYDRSELEISLSMLTSYGASQNNSNKGYICVKDNKYYMPYILVIVRVSNFDSNHDSTSADLTKWLPGLNSENLSCTYSVVAVLDSRDVSTQSATNLYLNEGECFHIVMVPFSLSNTAYLEGSNMYNGTSTYHARFQIDFKYRRKDNFTSGTSTDFMNAVLDIKRKVSEYTALSFGFDPASSTMNISELLANNFSTTHKASSLNMSYSKFTSADGFSQEEIQKKLSVKIYPYNTEDYYFLYSGTSVPQKNRSFPAFLKITNIQTSANSGITLKYKGNQTRIISDSITVITTDNSNEGPVLEFLVATTLRDPIPASQFYRKELYATLSFDLFPYIETTNTSLAGDYTMTLVAEFSIQ